MSERGDGDFSINDLRVLAAGDHHREVHKFVVQWVYTLPYERNAVLVDQVKKHCGRTPLASAIEVFSLTALASLGLVGSFGLFLILISVIGAALPGMSNGVDGMGMCSACCVLPLLVLGSLVWAGSRVRDTNIARGLLSDQCCDCGYGLEGLGSAGGGVTCPECGTPDPRATLAPWVLSRMRERAQGLLAKRAIKHAGRRTRRACVRAWSPGSDRVQNELKEVVVPAGFTGALTLAFVTGVYLSIEFAPKWTWLLPISMSLVIGWFCATILARARFIRGSMLERVRKGLCPCCGGLPRPASKDCDLCESPIIKVEETVEFALADRYGVPESVFVEVRHSLPQTASSGTGQHIENHGKGE